MNSRTIRILGVLAFSAVVALCAITPAQAVSLTTANYSENFDEPKLAPASVTGHWSGTAQNAVPGTSGWTGVRAGGSGTTMNYSVNSGASNAGAIYSYGETTPDYPATLPERALGSVASGTNIAAFGVELTNNTSGEITSVDIDYIGEYWRSSTTSQNVLTFGYLIGAAGSTSFLTDPATGFASLDLVGPAPVGANGLLNGNINPNRAAFSGTIPLSLPVGQSLYIRWTDTNDIGNDAGLAVDDFELVATIVPEPATFVLAAFGLVGIVAARRSRRLAK